MPGELKVPDGHAWHEPLDIPPQPSMYWPAKQEEVQVEHDDVPGKSQLNHINSCLNLSHPYLNAVTRFDRRLLSCCVKTHWRVMIGICWWIAVNIFFCIARFAKETNVWTLGQATRVQPMAMVIKRRQRAKFKLRFEAKGASPLNSVLLRVGLESPCPKSQPLRRPVVKVWQMASCSVWLYLTGDCTSGTVRSSGTYQACLRRRICEYCCTNISQGTKTKLNDVSFRKKRFTQIRWAASRNVRR